MYLVEIFCKVTQFFSIMQINRSFLLKYLFIAFLFLCCVLCVPYRLFSARRCPGESMVSCAGDFHEPVLHFSSFSPSVAYLRQCYPVRCPAGRLVLAAVPASLLCSVRAISMSPFCLSPCALSPSLFILSSFSPSVAYLRQCYPVRCPAVRLVLAAVPASLLCSVPGASNAGCFSVHHLVT